jgi:hypothetical protein
MRIADAYSDLYAPGPESEWPASRGKNLGYGANAPRMPGTVVLALGRMNRILELDVGLGLCVLEPGVAQRGLVLLGDGLSRSD